MILFGVAPAGDMCQKKISYSQGLSNLFGIADDILIAGFIDMGRDHDATLTKVLTICRQANLRLNKDKYLSHVQGIPCWGR